MIEHLNYNEFQEKIGDTKNGFNFNSIVNQKTIVDFYAPWCSPCKTLSPILEDINSEEIKVYKVNIEDEYKLASDLEIKSIPTVLFLDENKENFVKLGLLNKNQILEIFNKI